MDSYRISKAWHLGHEVAEAIHYLVKILPDDGSNLKGYLRKHSVMVPHLITLSTSRKQKSDQLYFYVQARQAAIDLLEHLATAKSQKIIEKDYYHELANKVIEAQRQLTIVIRKTKLELADAK